MLISDWKSFSDSGFSSHILPSSELDFYLLDLTESKEENEFSYATDGTFLAASE